MQPWYNVFSYWGFVLALLSPWLPFSVLLIMILNLIGTIIFISVSHMTVQVRLFLVAIHAIPVWYMRKNPIQVLPTICVYMLYVMSLAIQGIDPVSVYKSLLNEPPQTIHSYLIRRGLV